jgi:hypothetical protein
MMTTHDDTAPRIPVREAGTLPDPYAEHPAIDELAALARDGRGHYVTEATRATVRRVTGLALTAGATWNAGDIATALRAMAEAGTLSDPYAGDCGCGHSPTEHPNGGPCAGTGATLDPIYGIPTDEACACVAYAEAD